ncbi:hypothetical protein [Micromonospora sp. L32]|uniref:hypothetical protein n=1 Tax=Micromonospora sp. L32 TaxID=3452214 RepID=UPI003F8959B1
MEFNWLVPFLAPAATVGVAFLTHYLTKRREASGTSTAGISQDDYERIAESIAGFRHGRPSRTEVATLSAFFPAPKELERRLQRRISNNRFFLGLLLGSAVFYMVTMLLWSNLQQGGDVTKLAAPSPSPSRPTVASTGSVGPGGAQCPEIVVAAVKASGVALTQPLTLEARYADSDTRAYVCKQASGQAFYFGINFAGTLSGGIALRAVASGEGFEAEYRGTTYYIDSNKLQIR